jgi:hypothetical protein
MTIKLKNVFARKNCPICHKKMHLSGKKKNKKNCWQCHFTIEWWKWKYMTKRRYLMFRDFKEHSVIWREDENDIVSNFIRINPPPIQTIEYELPMNITETKIKTILTFS